MIGVQKSQISRIERNAKNVTIETIWRVFGALKAKVNFNVELLDGELRIAQNWQFIAAQSEISKKIQSFKKPLKIEFIEIIKL